jgi:ATP sulfurylase
MIIESRSSTGTSCAAICRRAWAGTRVRELLLEGEPLPIEFTRPEVAEILRSALAKGPTVP